MNTQPHSLPDSSFAELQLHHHLITVLKKYRYLAPTPIQQSIIPLILEGMDVVGQAQTGTGKTAAFALPLLQMVAKTNANSPQVLVLTPTRELALQVSESFAKYGEKLSHLNVIALYGGQEYTTQLRQLKKGAQVVVGTPGRTIDLIRRGSLDISKIRSFVLDEADEMLKMGFIDDVEWILSHSPEKKQVALFSATMPAKIRNIASRHLKNPKNVTIQKKTASPSKIAQSYAITNGQKAKNALLEKLLQSVEYDGVLIFVKTRSATNELSEVLQAKGYSCGPLNGDIPQKQRTRMVQQLKSGGLDIVVATDVAARGLDVERISHVINYDVPQDEEAYIHRIGRTGRAGRPGTAVLFLHPREKRILRNIEKQTGQHLLPLKLPTSAEINRHKLQRFKHSLSTMLSRQQPYFVNLVDKFCRENNSSPADIAAALLQLLHGHSPLFLEDEKEAASKTSKAATEKTPAARPGKKQPGVGRTAKDVDEGMERYRLEAGESHGVKPTNIVGAIANEADIDSRYIGKIAIYSNHSTVDLPYGMPPEILNALQRTRVCNRMMLLRREGLSLPPDVDGEPVRKKKRKAKKSRASH